MNIATITSRTAAAAALALALGLGAAPGAQAAPTTSAVAQAARGDDGGGWQGEGGLTLNAADNARVDAFADRAKRAERSISPQVRAAARLSSAELVGFDHRLKSPDSLKRKVATAMKEHPGQSVNEALADIKDSVRYTLQWPDARYTAGVTVAAQLLSVWGNDSTKWSNTWGRAKGYRAINSGWRAPRSEHLFEVQFHTPASKNAQEVTHKLYEEQRLPGTSPERAKELQEQQDAIFAAVPVPQGADRLSGPAPTRAAPVG
ncbi:ATP nucleotide 3'-pyrophosphokinase [Streptomyces triculaminicus]|uniref:ATP nucleotide 3'-pyrophosphokinase n=1 Tax=Streptomyces triculaminicus TaxID=2816232 RepID=UPI0033D7B88E